MTNYHIYGSPSPGLPIDYSTILATVSGTSWPTPPLTAGVWKFGVRAFDTVSGLEEQNVDAVVEIDIAADLSDATAVPLPPQGLAAHATAGDVIRVTWSAPIVGPGVVPSGFHVYKGTGGVVSYVTPAATVAYGVAGPYHADLAGLTDGTTYTIGVRAFGSTGNEERNTVTVDCTADGTPPDDVDYLTAT